MTESHTRRFTGVFIPARVWLDPKLNCTEKCLLAEIGALGGHDGQCYASNEYLGQQVGLSGKRAKAIIAKLKDMGLVKQVKFDGRTRWLHVFYDRSPVTLEGTGRRPENEPSDGADSSPLTAQIQAPSSTVEKEGIEEEDGEPPDGGNPPLFSNPPVERLNGHGKEIVEAWNATDLPRCLALNPTREQKLRARLRDPFWRDHWREAISRVQASAFCGGTNNRGWRAGFDWFLQPDVVCKIMEGKYDNHEPVAAPRYCNPNI